MQHCFSSTSERHGILCCRLLCVALGLAFITSVAIADAGSAGTKVRPQAQHSGGLVQFAHGRLSLDVENVLLERLLREIAAEAKFTLVFSGRLEERITIAFDALPLDKALRRLLRNRNFALEYSEVENTDKRTKVARPTTLWIYTGTTKGADAPQTARFSEQSQSPPVAAVPASPEPADRGAAAETLADQRDAASVPALRLALRDRDQQVREAAIAALVEIGGDEAANALAVALTDEHPWLREVAVSALGEIGGETAIRLLQQALSDTDASVKELAAAMLEQLKH